jgi:hypothetical protein
MKTYDFQAPTPQGPAAADQQAFLLAVTFHESALRASVTEHDPDGVPISALCPMIVSYAFAAELYLKALATAGTGRLPAKVHLMTVLFNRLSPDVQSQIAEVYLRRTGRTEAELKADVARFADAFREWRYVYEGDGRQVHTNLLIAFTQSVYEVVRALFPDWKVNATQDVRFRAADARGTMTVFNLGGGTFIEAIDGTEGQQLNAPDAR